jgi:predicted nucleic acid-binding protein
VAAEEVLTVGDEGEDQHPRIAALVAQGDLEEFDIQTPAEQRELVRFALQLDDGEAHTCALAVVRGGCVATDDRKAIRVLGEILEQPCLHTSQLLRQWAEQERVPHEELARLLRSIARRASFLPPRADPNFQWWMDLMADPDRV